MAYRVAILLSLLTFCASVPGKAGNTSYFVTLQDSVKIHFFNRDSVFHKVPPPNSIKSPAATIPCETAQVACSQNIYSFPSGTTGTAPFPVNGYPNYGCLGGYCQGPAWYYMQIGVPGDIILTITQVGPPPAYIQNDVDFVCWGPFTSVTEGCASGLTSPNIVDCSFAPWNVETCHILNAQVGQIYILLMTNFSGQDGTLTFSQTSGNGQTNCNLVVHCSMINISTNTSVCNPGTNTFSVSGNAEFSNPPPNGTLTITDNTALPPVSQNFTAPFVSPRSYSLTNIPCDGLSHSITAVFSDSTSCTITQQCTSPAAICPSGVISGGGTICDDGTSQADVSIAIAGPSPPFSFTYALNGLGQPPVSNYSGPFPYHFTTGIAGTYTLLSLTSNACPSGGPVSGSAAVILSPLPLAAISGSATVCMNAVSPLLTFTGSAGTPPYTFMYRLNGGSTLTVTTAGGNTATIMAPTNATGILTYTLLGVQEGSPRKCSQVQSGSVQITINPLPYVNLTLCNDPKTTTTSRPFALKGGLPPGGLYYIDGVQAAGGMFNPPALTPSVHNVTYSFTVSNGCTNSSVAIPITVIGGGSAAGCPTSFTDPRDNKSYRATSLGSHCWMLANLDYGNIMSFDSYPQSDNCIPEKYCTPSDPGCTIYGGVYQWDELMQYQIPAAGISIQGLCPPEWHIPSQAEWQDLINAVAAKVPGDGLAGGNLKDTIPVNGFHALLRGIFYLNNTWAFTSGALDATMYWTSASSGTDRAVARGLNTSAESVSVYNSARSNAFPARCVKD